MDIGVIINQMIQLFLVITLGYILNKIDIFDEILNKKLSKLLLSVTTPALILNSVLSNKNTTEFSQVLTVFIMTFLVYTLLPIISFGLVKVLRIPKKDQGIYMFMTIFSNIGFMGFPVLAAIFGNGAIFYTAIFNLGFNLLMFSFGLSIINYGTQNKVKLSIKQVLTPGVLASLLALIIYFTKISFPIVIVNTCSMVGGLTTPIAMLLIGSTLANMPIKEVFNDVKLYPYTIIRQIVMPIIAFFILQNFIKDTYLLGVTFIVLAMPVANSAVLFATQYGGDVKLAAKSVFLTTLTSVVTIPLLVYLFLI